MTAPRVLIIDDDRTLLDLLRVYLTSGGLKIEVAEDAAIAIRTILASPPDLIILDIELPFLNGMEVLAALKSDASTRDIPVIVLTARTDEECFVQANNLGAEGFLRKPVERDALINEIFSKLARRAAKKAKLDALPPA
jgi:DNA-binding response OmpR family regulator